MSFLNPSDMVSSLSPFVLGVYDLIEASFCHCLERIKSNFEEIKLKADDIEKISSLGSETPKRYVELITLRLTFEKYRLVVCNVQPPITLQICAPSGRIGLEDRRVRDT